MKDEFKKVIEQYLEVKRVMPGNLPVAKGKITKIVNLWRQKEDPIEIRREIKDVLSALFLSVDDYCVQRFIPEAYYCGSDGNIYGWYSDDPCVQFQAEELPLTNFPDSVYVNPLVGCDWNARGFAPAWELILKEKKARIKIPDEKTESMNRATIPVSEVRFPARLQQEIARHGYANPCPLQWHWSRENGGMVIDRSIPSHGFWRAWKWHPSSRDWFLENCPELFEDADWWDVHIPPVRHEPPDNPYAAVLGAKK